MYYSSTGANYKMSKWAAETAEKEGAEVRRLIFKETAPKEAIEANDAWKSFRENEAKNEKEVSLEDLEWADAFIFNIPTRYGNLPSQVQAFIDTTGGLWFEGKLADKLVTATTSAMNMNGGQESTLQSLYKTTTHWGCIMVPPGYTDKVIFESSGNPYGTSATVDQTGNIQNEQNVKAALEHQVRRLLQTAKKFLNANG